MFRGIGQGQREIIQSGRESEVGIPLQQAGVALIAGLVGALVFQRWAIVPLGDFVLSYKPQWYESVSWLQRAFFWIALGLLELPVFKAVFSSMLVNIYDPRHPATHSPVPADYGPSAPPAVAWLAGWRQKRIVEQPMTLLEGRGGQPDKSKQIVRANLLIQERPGHTHNPQPELSLEDWEKLRAAIAAGSSLSVRDLQEHGFTSGPDGSARRVNDAICSWRGLTERGAYGKPFPTAPFREWIAAGGFYGQPSPTPKAGDTHRKTCDVTDTHTDTHAND